MNKAKYYHVSDTGLSEGVSLGRITVVLGADFDTAQYQLAALREELTHKIEAYQGAHMMCTDLKASLADAELRNAVLFGLLERWYTANCNDLIHVEDGAYRIVLDTNEALNKPEEAKS